MRKNKLLKKLEYDQLGLKVVSNPLLCSYERYTVRRTWKQRLFEKPWQPFRKYKVKIKTNPHERREGNVLYCHPLIYDEIKKRVESIDG